MASTKSSSGVDELTALLSILSTSVSAMTKEQPNFPSLYETTPQPPSPPTPEIMLAVQAAKQLLATLDPLYAVGAAVQVRPFLLEQQSLQKRINLELFRFT